MLTVEGMSADGDDVALVVGGPAGDARAVEPVGAGGLHGALQAELGGQDGLAVGHAVGGAGELVGWLRTSATVLGKEGLATRLSTTLPTAILPSRGWLPLSA